MQGLARIVGQIHRGASGGGRGKTEVGVRFNSEEKRWLAGRHVARGKDKLVTHYEVGGKNPSLEKGSVTGFQQSGRK